jgi:hypothetical protein
MPFGTIVSGTSRDSTGVTFPGGEPGFVTRRHPRYKVGGEVIQKSFSNAAAAERAALHRGSL